jgi:tetratricopeptide (TPR) repeat protein
MELPASVLQRLRTSLAPRIAVERYLAAGGMGAVFIGRDTVLDRPVAIKVLPPERATAVLTERFLREGRAAARVAHPNVVPVYDAGLADGLPYYVMALVDGPTLAHRLKDGPIPPVQAMVLARDILSALIAMHGQGLVHRDIKPSNIFLQRGHALLGDFGIVAVRDAADDPLTTPNDLMGTPLYMAPEQLAGRDATERSDLYALAAVVYETCTGIHWDQLKGAGGADWSAVPRWLRAPLVRALQTDPSDRWPDARSFRAALDRSRRQPIALAAAALLLAAGAGGYFAPRLVGRGGEKATDPAYDIVVFPFGTDGQVDTSVTGQLTRATRWYFEPFPAIRMPHTLSVDSAWRSTGTEPLERLAGETGRLGATFGVWAWVESRADRLEINARLVNRRGGTPMRATVEGDSADILGVANQLGARLAGLMGNDLVPAGAAQHHPDAVIEYMQGESAVERDAWLTAERHYQRALALDSTFLLAAWRLGNARRWMPLRPTPPFPPNFRDLFARYAQDLPPTDSLLIEAQFAPSGAARLAVYDSALATDPGGATTMLLFGDELFHRGPLAGHSLAEAATMLRRATAANAALAPAWEHLTWALVRLGREPEAAEALGNLLRVAGERGESELYLPDFLQVAFTARFSPAKLDAAAGPLLARPEALMLAARGALAFDLPTFELEFGRRLAQLDEAAPAQRATGFVAQGVGLMALGRPLGALAKLDSAAALFPDPTVARRQAAQWRVLAPALGVPGVGEAAREVGRRTLEAMADRDPGAAWALGMDALAGPESGREGAGRWYPLATTDASGGGPFTLLLTAMEAANRGDYQAALVTSAPALALDSAGAAPDPFFRATLHLLRGRWQDRAKLAEDADRSWLWYENTDAVGWPQQEAQPADVDWALGSYARLLRAELARRAGRRGVACAQAARLDTLWVQPEPGFAPAVDRLRAISEWCRT